MNLKEKLSNKTIAYWLGCAAAVIALVGLIIFAVYKSRAGEGTGWIFALIIIGILAQVALFFYDGKYGDFIAILPPVLYVLSLALGLSGGVGNIADAVSDIIMFGIPELAPLNYAIAAILGAATIVAVVLCFMTREKQSA